MDAVRPVMQFYQQFYHYKYMCWYVMMSSCTYRVHPEIRKGSTGSTRAMAIYETGVGTNWRFWRFFDQ